MKAVHGEHCNEINFLIADSILQITYPNSADGVKIEAEAKISHGKKFKRRSKKKPKTVSVLVDNNNPYFLLFIYLN